MLSFTVRCRATVQCDMLGHHVMSFYNMRFKRAPTMQVTLRATPWDLADI